MNIRKVSNGYMVVPTVTFGAMTPDDEINVFETFDGLVNHLSKAFGERPPPPAPDFNDLVARPLNPNNVARLPSFVGPANSVFPRPHQGDIGPAWGIHNQPEIKSA